MNLVLETRSLGVRLGRTQALNSVDLHIRDLGHVIGLFGQNGAGKTTLLRVLAGLVNRYSGEITVPDNGVAYLPDESFLPGFLKIEELLGLGRDLFSDFDGTVAQDIFSTLNLRTGMRLSEASRGMLEQIHLGFVLARRSSLYLFDEPLAAVDPLTRDKLIDMIGKFRNSGSTVIISTHLIGGLESLFDEAIVIHDGRIVLHDNVEDIASQGGLEGRFKEIMRNYDLVD